MNHTLIKNKDTTQFQKNGVDFVGYGKIANNMSIVVETVEQGHFEEFVHLKSTFTYLFLEGKGIFIFNDEKIEV